MKRRDERAVWYCPGLLVGLLLATAAVLMAPRAHAQGEGEPAPKPSPSPAAGLRVTVGAGSLTSLGAGPTSIEPAAQIQVSTPLYQDVKGAGATRLEVDAALTALPGETLDLSDVETFRALEFEGRICQPLHVRLFFTPCLSAGFATRLPGDAEPRHRTARWFAFVLRIASERGDFTVGLSADERLEPGSNRALAYRPAALVSGGVRIAGFKGAEARLVGRAILALKIGGWALVDTPADRVAVGVMVAR